jgi:branched-chain amino acid transport system substrate-binding protein
VLDKAVTAAGAIDSDSLSAALGTLGSIDDSPRGPWTFDNQNPKQVFYLREVVDEGGTLSNKVLEELGTFAQP